MVAWITQPTSIHALLLLLFLISWISGQANGLQGLVYHCARYKNFPIVVGSTGGRTIGGGGPTQRFSVKDDDNVVNSEGDSKKRGSRWGTLHPKAQQRFRKSALPQQQQQQQPKRRRDNSRMIGKGEPNEQKKRRLLIYVEEKKREKKRDLHITRLLPLDSSERKPLADLIVGMEMNGLVISLTNFGAYIDIGTECDGLLHVSQISLETFVDHPRKVFSPGQNVTVRIRSFNPQRKKLHLTLLPLEPQDPDLENDNNNSDDQRNDGIPLDQIRVDEELWGELQRVTNFGAYVDVGAIVPGFLHFMDHPSWDPGALPRDFMQTGDRVRVWVSKIDPERQRIQLTAHRPKHLPGPQRELPF